jgi:hypothetical protein
MSLGKEIMTEFLIERDMYFRAYENKVIFLEDLEEETLLDLVINEGKALNEFKAFPAYDIACRARRNNWKLTTKQVRALINVTAVYLLDKEMDND